MKGDYRKTLEGSFLDMFTRVSYYCNDVADTEKKFIISITPNKLYTFNSLFR